MPLSSQVQVDPATSGTPQNVAAETISTKLYQGVLVCDASGNIQGSASNPLRTTSPDSSVSSTIAAVGQTVSVPLDGSGTVYLSISGTWSGTLLYESTANGTDWTSSVQGVNVSSGGISSSTTLNRDVMIPTSGAQGVRVRATAWASGTAARWKTRPFSSR